MRIENNAERNPLLSPIVGWNCVTILPDPTGLRYPQPELGRDEGRLHIPSVAYLAGVAMNALSDTSGTRDHWFGVRALMRLQEVGLEDLVRREKWKGAELDEFVRGVHLRR